MKKRPGTGRGQIGGEWTPDHVEDCGTQACGSHGSDSSIAETMRRTAELGSSDAVNSEDNVRDMWGMD